MKEIFLLNILTLFTGSGIHLLRNSVARILNDLWKVLTFVILICRLHAAWSFEVRMENTRI